MAKLNNAVRDYLRDIGRKGGSAKTKAKELASQKNGIKGGRPPQGKTK